MFVISLGAGVQSSTMALMAARGEIGPMPDYAIFADTGWESSRVYEWLDWLTLQLPFPVIRAVRPGLNLGDLSKGVANGTTPLKGSSLPPFFTANPNGMRPKQCSKEFKTRVIGREIRHLLGLSPAKRGPKVKSVEQWLGISLDEISRCKDAEQSFTTNRFPLIELSMRRNDCLKWMADRQYPTPPRSSCIFCPYKTDSEWRDLRDNFPADWKKVVAFDHEIRRGFPGMMGAQYVHRQRVPLDQVDLSTPADRGQIEFGFIQECDGMCGV